MPTSLTITRKGVGNEWTVETDNAIPDTALAPLVSEGLPRVEIIELPNKVDDSVTNEQISTTAHEFMRGIFYYAGLDPDAASDLFAQNDETSMELHKASAVLNAALRRDWSQGEELDFSLGHDSKAASIEFRIQDPTVRSRFVRASRRSSGFTHYFTIKTILYARQNDNPAHSYIFLFDEPGIHLHPRGQLDLLRVLDAVGRHNQVAYTTHSLFMLNKTFPTRHRMLVKDSSGGTKLDSKPWVGRWGPAIEVLGLSITGTILFAQYVLLVEGDSDPIFMEAMFQKLVEMGEANVDL